MKKYNVKKITEARRIYTFTEPNKKGEKIVVEITSCKNSGDPHALPKLWKKHGFINRELESYLTVNTYIYNETGCWGLYNPQEKTSEDGKRRVIDFKWMFEATPKNEAALIAEVVRRAYA